MAIDKETLDYGRRCMELVRSTMHNSGPVVDLDVLLARVALPVESTEVFTPEKPGLSERDQRVAMEVLEFATRIPGGPEMMLAQLRLELDGVVTEVNDLVRLRRLASEACDAARDDVNCQKDPVNWGDFGCVIAERVVDHTGEVSLRVWLEEADPNCPAIERFVMEYLAREGFTNVQVKTEW